MKIGLTGFPKSGKTSVFFTVTCLTSDHEAHSDLIASVDVPDERLDRLAQDFQKPKSVHAKIEYLDPYVAAAGLEDALAPFLNAVKDADVLGLVVRAFEDPNVPHLLGSVDPKRDVRLLLEEMFKMDIAVCERRLPRIEATLKKAKSEELEKEREVIVKCLAHLNDSVPIIRASLRPEERTAIQGIQFLTAKTPLFIINCDEQHAATAHLQRICAQHEETIPEYAGATALCARLERELLELEECDREEFIADAGLECLAKDRIIRASYGAADIVSFFTIGDHEVRSWPVKAGSPAVEAAGTVHTDMMRGFIRAEVLSFEDYVKAGSMRDAKAQHLVRLEGKDYVVKDGDIIYFRFNV